MSGHANRGKAWEAQLNHQHSKYRKAGRGAIWQTFPPRNARGVYLAKSPPDFMGVLSDGRAVCFDAKDHRGKRFPFNKIKDHQAQDLQAVHDSGGVAFIALRLDGRRWWISWLAIGLAWWDWREKRSKRASVDVAWLDEYALEFEGADWLGALGL